jgi:hypothetical protein
MFARITGGRQTAAPYPPKADRRLGRHGDRPVGAGGGQAPGRLWRLSSKGYTFQEEMLLSLHRSGAKFAEVPIIFENRARGKSKADLREIIKGAFHLLRLGFRR